MRAVGMPNGLSAVGYVEADCTNLADGAWPHSDFCETHRSRARNRCWPTCSRMPSAIGESVRNSPALVGRVDHKDVDPGVAGDSGGHRAQQASGDQSRPTSPTTSKSAPILDQLHQRLDRGAATARSSILWRRVPGPISASRSIPYTGALPCNL